MFKPGVRDGTGGFLVQSEGATTGERSWAANSSRTAVDTNATPDDPEKRHGANIISQNPCLTFNLVFAINTTSYEKDPYAVPSASGAFLLSDICRMALWSEIYAIDTLVLLSKMEHLDVSYGDNTVRIFFFSSRKETKLA